MGTPRGTEVRIRNLSGILPSFQAAYQLRKESRLLDNLVKPLYQPNPWICAISRWFMKYIPILRMQFNIRPYTTLSGQPGTGIMSTAGLAPRPSIRHLSE